MSYLKPQPVPPNTIAAKSIAPAIEPIMIFVPLGPVDRQTENKKHAFVISTFFHGTHMWKVSTWAHSMGHTKSQILQKCDKKPIANPLISHLTDLNSKHNSLLYFWTIKVLKLTENELNSYTIPFRIQEKRCWSSKSRTPVWLNVLGTFVLLRTVLRLEVWNRVIYTAVLPSVVCVADTLHFITARLRQRERERTL